MDPYCETNDKGSGPAPFPGKEGLKERVWMGSVSDSSGVHFQEAYAL